MHNIHAHAWNVKDHISDSTIRQMDLSRGRPLDISVPFDKFEEDMRPFDRVAVCGLKARLTGFWVPDEYIAAFVKQAPHKFIGFASCDPTQNECLEELRHACETLSLRGVKMGPMYAGFHPEDPRCEPIYEYCQNRGLPILFHTGTTFLTNAPLECSRPLPFDRIAMKFPALKMVLAHLSHPYYEECLVVIRKHPNLYADISALYYRPWQFYNMLITAQEYHVTHKLLFGTDYPFAASNDSIAGLQNINNIIGNSGLPKVSAETIDAILNRDSFNLLGLK